MVSDEESQRLDTVKENAEVIEETFTVEEVIRSQKEIPWETAEPRQAMNSVDLVTNADDLLETLYLNRKCLKLR